MSIFDDSILLSIRQEIISFVDAEERVLSTQFKKGIYFMPEIALVYGVGKAIVSNAKNIFPSRQVEWSREIQVGEDGPCDLVLDVIGGGQIVLEFKTMHRKYESYEHDIVKLKNLVGDQRTRLFCALSYVYEKKAPEGDERIQQLEHNHATSIRRIGNLHNFATWVNYTGERVHCVIGLWEVF